eukprot:TRINITY_DN487_c0_g1_i1.p1 TRINITY_DN487_c0_g1~~TRINITY_DN487_c0_g1_i1.p1  ORF type:complete len:748 (+),score=126.71 TRINITY_DN487_c0_g1_i1:29-2245(+)
MYRLSKELSGHQADVRSLCLLDNGKICSASRDNTIRVWDPTDNYESSTVLHGHQSFLSTVIPINSPYFAPANLASGGFDKIINLWDTSNPSSPLVTLIGHENVVCALCTTHDGLLVSGSWDRTVRIWRGNECLQVLTGHSHSVWALLSLPNGDLLTGSADKTIKIWRNYSAIKTFEAHTDCVRSLVLFNPVGFLSASNDGTLKLWSFDGESLREFVGHTAYIYSAAIAPNSTSLFVSGGEDRELKIWKDGEVGQSILHPGVIWSLQITGEEDIISGCSDGVVRIWTKDQARVAPSEIISNFERSLASIKLSTDQVGELNVNKLPAEDALKIPGQQDGENKIVRTAKGVECYQWSIHSNSWIKIGDVVDAVGQSHRHLLQGKEYDHIFDVDLGDGNPPRKLGYNVGENPYATAQEFIWREQLQQDYLDQIADFIVKNTQGFTIGAQSAPAAVDPYTGGSRYIPNQPTTTQQPTGGDPFTGQSRYIPSQYGAASNVNQTPQPTTPAQTGYTPTKSYVTYETASFPALVKKLMEFNAQAPAGLGLTADDQKEIDSIISTLKDTSHYHSSKFYPSQYQTLTKILSWPSEIRFPGIDLLRSLVVHPDAAEYLSKGGFNKTSGSTIIADIIRLGFTSSAPTSCQMLLTRVLANLFGHEQFREILQKEAEKVLESAVDCMAASNNKSLRQSLISIFLNYSVLFIDHPNEEGKIQLLSSLADLIPNEKDEDILLRGLVAVGNLVSS